jgi:hypothetical protein
MESDNNIVKLLVASSKWAWLNRDEEPKEPKERGD